MQLYKAVFITSVSSLTNSGQENPLRIFRGRLDDLGKFCAAVRELQQKHGVTPGAVSSIDRQDLPTLVKSFQELARIHGFLELKTQKPDVALRTLAALYPCLQEIHDALLEKRRALTHGR